MASGGQCWRVVASGGQWRPHVSLICAFLVPSWRSQVPVHSYELINCQRQVAIVANVANVADVADVVCVAIVAIVNARKCQCHRNYHHYGYEYYCWK